MFKAIGLLFLASGWVLAAASVHVVRTPASLTTVSILPKDSLGFDDTYVDTREWNLEEAGKHPDLVKRVIAAGRTDLLAHVADSKSQRDVATQLAEAVGRERSSENAAATATAAGKGKPITAAALNMAVNQYKAGKLKASDLARMVAASEAGD